MHIFTQEEHDEFICGHILSGSGNTESVEHMYNEDGTVTVYFPDSVDVEAKVATYNRDDYLVPIVPLDKRIKDLEERVAANKVILEGSIRV